MKIPPGVSPSDFSAALTEFENAVGKDWVFTSDEDVALYRDAYSPLWGEPDEIVASAAVAPDNVDEVQKVVKIANHYRIPIYPVSTGKNLGYGGSAPNYSGSVVLYLKRMNRILEVSEANAYALLEPGVSYFDLYRYIQEKGLKLWIDCPDPGWGSPIGNALDHGVGYTTARYRNHFDSHCGMEVVLASGEVIRTGMGAFPKAETWQQYKFGVGPWIDGIFSQSNFGVVTKMGLWLLPSPESYHSGTVTVPHYKDLIPLVQIVNYLENSGTTNGMPGFGSPLFFRGGFTGRGFPKPDPEIVEMFSKDGGPSPEEVDRYAEGKGIHCWSATLGFYGGAQVNAACWEFAKEKLSAIPGAKFAEGDTYKLPLAPEQMTMFDLPRFGIPSLQRFTIGARSETNPNPTNGHIWFSPIIPRTGEAIFEINRVLRPAFRELGLPSLSLFSLPAGYFERAFIFTFGFPITHDIEENKKMRASFKRVVQIAAEHGWGEYRTPPVFQDTVVNTYSYNNHALLRFNETLKDAVDPNGILSAGRYGIWPKHLRERKA
ncbi:MAG: FAD-binding oxidoreductase [Terriglobales bacterium]